MAFMMLVLVLASLFGFFAPASPTQLDDFVLYESGVDGKPIPPKSDPWYTAPPDFASAAPGQILRGRSAMGILTTTTGNCSAAYQILYRTTDSRSRPAWAVTTLFIPETMPNISNGSAELVSYQLAYNSADLNASPSYRLYISPVRDISHLLGRGFVVSVPDYEGPLAAYTAGISSGYATLDAVRAVRTAFSRSIRPGSDLRCAMWGYSGGALATEWAVELQALYAPDLNFGGVALGGLTPNITSVLVSVNGRAGAGLIPAAILGLLAQYPEVQDLVISKLKSEGSQNKTGFLEALNMTSAQASTAFRLQDIAEYFNGGFSFLQDPQVRRIINNEGQMGYHGLPQTSLYVYKAVADEVSPVNETDDLVRRYYGVGVSVTYSRNRVGGHAAESLNGQPAAIGWLQSVLAGGVDVTGCTIRDVAVGVANSSSRL
jgi:Secretory lipase